MRMKTVALCVCPLPFLLLSAAAGEPVFRRHAINPDSTYSACTAIDVNHDGRLDIVCGGYWYEAPAWERHFLREVEVIRGRYDDYSNLPLDVNGDGWMDYVSANYRSQSIYWAEHPGESLGAWERHVIDEPGPMETALLHDIDGDGRLDVLPNGTSFAAWYELVREKQDDGSPRVDWLRHDLPKEIAGHGVGFGDINGDGRGDIVGPRGFLEAPEDRRGGRWIWRPEWELHRDGSIPILVHDVDGDGDNDLVYGRGHNVGLYWLEQQRQEGGARGWQLHAIDTSWSQPHAILLADIDGDGRQDVVAGKRYMGHDGKDPGEYDPLAVYWYSFQPDSKTFRRGSISLGGGAGFGLDPAAVDIDGDGDLDLIGPGRSGLFLFENLLIGASGEQPGASGEDAALTFREDDDHRQPLTLAGEDGKTVAVDSPEGHAIRRWRILRGMEQVMGELPGPERRVPLDMKIVETTELETHTRQKITFNAEPDDRVSAFLLIPKGLKGRAPAMLCLHPTGPLGKGIVLGMSGRENRQYAVELAERGYVCLAPDYPSFGDLAEYDFAKDEYESGTMKAIWNNIRALDVLESLPQVDRDRIGCIGHSLGGHNGLFTAPFDLRIRAVVTSCGFTSFHRYYEGNLEGWTSDRYMPLIRDHYAGDPDKMPFDFHEVLAAISPRPVFINAPLKDSNFEVEGVREVVGKAAQVYELLGVKDDLVAAYPDAEHDFPPAEREQAYQFLDRHLKR